MYNMRKQHQLSSDHYVTITQSIKLDFVIYIQYDTFITLQSLVTTLKECTSKFDDDTALKIYLERYLDELYYNILETHKDISELYYIKNDTKFIRIDTRRYDNSNRESLLLYEIYVTYCKEYNSELNLNEIEYNIVTPIYDESDIYNTLLGILNNNTNFKLHKLELHAAVDDEDELRDKILQQIDYNENG